jgi:hypothetical protein
MRPQLLHSRLPVATIASIAFGATHEIHKCILKRHWIQEVEVADKVTTFFEPLDPASVWEEKYVKFSGLFVVAMVFMRHDLSS